MRRIVLAALAVGLAGCALKQVRVPLAAENDSGVSGEAVLAEVQSPHGVVVEAAFTAEDARGRPLRGFLYMGNCAQRGALAQDASIFERTASAGAATRLDLDLNLKSLSGRTHAFVVQEKTSAGEVLSCGDIP